MNKKFLFLGLLFIAFWYLPDFISLITFGMPLNEGLRKFAGNGFYYFGRDLDFYLEGIQGLKANSIWLLKPMAEVLPEVLVLSCIGISQLVCLYILKRKFSLDFEQKNQISLNSKHTAIHSIYLGLFISVISGCLLFSIELISYHYFKSDFLFSLIASNDKNQILLMGHPVYFCILLLVGCLGAALFEEYFFRKILFGLLRRNSSFIVASMVSSLFFCLAHQGDTLVWVKTFYCGFLSSIIYEKTKRIEGCVLFHFLGNLFLLILPLMYPLSAF